MSKLAGEGCKIIMPTEERKPLREIEKSIIKKYRKYTWSKFIKAIKDYKLVEEGDKIAVAISGGKDSLLMAKMFQELQKHGQVKFDLVFLAMDPGYHKNIRQLLKYTYGFVIIISLVIYTAIFFNSSFIVKAFNSENNAWLAQIADIGLKLYFTSLIFAGFNIATSVLFTSIEKPLFAQIISLLRGFAVIIPLSFLMAHFFGLTGVWLCVPLTEAVVFAVATVFIIKNLKKL